MRQGSRWSSGLGVRIEGVGCDGRGLLIDLGCRGDTPDRIEERAGPCQLGDGLHECVLAQPVEVDVCLRDDRGVRPGAFDRRGDRAGTRRDELVGCIDLVAGERHAPPDGDPIGAGSLEHDEVDRRAAQGACLQSEGKVRARLEAVGSHLQVVVGRAPTGDALLDLIRCHWC